jgi:hypothetical protein
MWMMWLGAALIIGLLVGLYIVRQMKRSAKLDSFKGKVATCPGCQVDVVAAGTWKRTAVLASRGDLFECAACGLECGFDMDRTVPLLVYTGRTRKERETKPVDPTPTPTDPVLPGPIVPEEPKKPWWRRRRKKDV